MTDPAQPVQAAAEQGTYQGGAGLIVPRLPDEVGIPLRLDDFQTLCDGGISESRASRDLCIGIFIGVVVGIAGIFAIADWEFVWKAEHRNAFLFWVGLLLVLAAGSAVGAVIFWIRCHRIAANSTYSRLVARLTKQYQAQTSSPPIADTAMASQNLTILQAQYGVEGRYVDVTQAVARQVKNATLQMVVDNHLHSTDPCPNVLKHLVVSFRHNGLVYKKRVNENQELSLP